MVPGADCGAGPEPAAPVGELTTARRGPGSRRARVGLAACLLALPAAGCGDGPAAVAESRSDRGGPPPPPNVVWMVADTLEPPFGRHVTALAAEGASYEVAARPLSAAGTRATLLTGADPEAIGLGDDGLSGPPPAGVRLLPERLRRAGYYTSRRGPPLHNLSAPAANGAEGAGSSAPAQPGLLGAWDAAGPDADWRGRRKDWDYPCTVAFGCGGPPHDPERPFFALFNLTATGAALDAEVGSVLAALAEDGLEPATAVFLTGSAPGVPLIVRWPAGTIPDAAGAEPVRVVDLAPTALALAGAPAPQYMTGRSLVAAGAGVATRAAERGAARLAAAEGGGAEQPQAAARAGGEQQLASGGQQPAGGERPHGAGVAARAAERGAARQVAAEGGGAEQPQAAARAGGEQQLASGGQRLAAGERVGIAVPAAAAVPGFDRGAGPGAPPAPPAPVALPGAGGPPTASTPAGYPTGGLFHVAPRVELWCDTEGSTIVYTTEREAPFYWRLYTGPFRMRFWTLRAQCGRLGYRDSEVLRYEFDIE